MKTRRSLLMGLGILMTLSMTVPVFASQQNTQGVVKSSVEKTEQVEAAEDTETEDQETEDQKESADTQEEETEVKGAHWVQGEHEGEWKLQIDGADTDKTGAVELDEAIYYIKEGVLCTGFQTIANAPEAEEEAVLEDGIYYFGKEGTEPGKDDYGKMLTAQWASEEDENGNVYWYSLGEDGKADTSTNGWVEMKENTWLFAENGKSVVKAGWQEMKAGTWYYLKEDGSRDKEKTGYQSIGDYKYYLNEAGAVQTGFQTADGKTYYFAADGKQQNYTGWKSIDGKAYFFNSQYQLSAENANGWKQIDGNWYWFESGKTAAGWRQIKNKWYYMDPETGVMQTGFYNAGGKRYYSDASGAMIGGGWHLLGGTWYYMQGSGAITKGWFKSGQTWYWLGDDGAMRTGWYTANGKQYYSNASGAMQTGWIKTNGTWYYLNGSGAMTTGWQKIGNTWYYMNSDGAMQTGWLKLGNTWYYLNGSGAMVTGWQRVGGSWYYFNGSGAMQTGWYKVGGTWYYSEGSGRMLTGWQQIGGKWYYLASSGAMAANKWIDGYYYVNGSGAMVTNTWVGQYYVGKDGRWIPNYNPVTSGGKWVQEGSKWYYQTADGARLANRWQRINGKWYWFDASGVMATGWKYIDGLKYYFKESGEMLQDLDSVIGRQSSYRITVNRVKNQVTVYAQDGAKGYIIPVKTFTCSVGMPDTPTPTGTYSTLEKYRVKELMGPSWGKWATRIVGGVLFHSVACSSPEPTYALPAGEYNRLGNPASHGCIRLNVRDAKWIYDNCKIGTSVTIGDNEIKTPFDKPGTIKIPAGQNWDPTDPDVKR